MRRSIGAGRAGWMLAALLLAGAACGNTGSGGDEPFVTAPRPAPDQRREVDSATAGSVRGIVLVEGAVPAPAPLHVKEPGCLPVDGEPPTDDVLLVSEGRLANAVVWVAAGLEGYRFEPPDQPADIRHTGCRLQPRVTAVMTEQSVRVHNDDPLLHNTRVTSERNSWRNFVQPPEAGPCSFGFRRAELALRIACDVHPWTSGAIAVLDNPCFAVTGPGGSYEITGLPPGRHTLQAWHELLGVQSVEVEIAPSAEARAPAIVFKGP